MAALGIVLAFVCGAAAAAGGPDGYTMLLITTTHTVTPALAKKLPYDAANDFAAVSLAVAQPNVLVVHPSVPARSVKELVALARAKPAVLTYASAAAAAPLTRG
jgi:tripartite-type tricarboxylate transporter receptor subunit TctC